MFALGLPYLLISVGFAVHAMKTGRPFWWLYLILFVPVIGWMAYVVIELLPSMAQSRGARAVATNITTIIDPNRDWRERVREAELVDSVDAKRALAEECERRGMWDDAVKLYETCAAGVFADDPLILTGLARAHLEGGNAQAALDVLEKLKQDHPKTQNQEAHLLYARALETLGAYQEALDEYQALSSYYAGFEARTRYALLLLRQGEPAQASALFQDIVRASNARSILIRPSDKEWIKVAKSHLR